MEIEDLNKSDPQEEIHNKQQYWSPEFIESSSSGLPGNGLTVTVRDKCPIQTMAFLNGKTNLLVSPC